MALPHESPRFAGAPAVRVGVRGARARTGSALGTSRERCAGATPSPGSARSAGFLALAALLGLAACDPYVQGNGVYLEQDRTPGGAALTGVHVEDGIEVTVTSGASEQKVTVSGDANLVEYIVTDVQNEASGPVLHLRIDVPGGWSSTIPPRAVVHLAQLQYLLAKGDSPVDVSGAAAPLLTILASEGSDVVVAGAGGAGIAVTASSARVDARTYPVTDVASVDLTEGARVYLHSDAAVTGTVREACTLDNLLGAGTCAAVVVEGPATLLCNP